MIRWNLKLKRPLAAGEEGGGGEKIRKISALEGRITDKVKTKVKMSPLSFFRCNRKSPRFLDKLRSKLQLEGVLVL